MSEIITNDYQAERALVTALYAEPELLSRVRLTVDDFWHFETRAAFERVRQADAEGRTVLLEDLALDIQSADAIAHPSFVREYARRIADKARQRRTLEAATRLAQAAAANDPDAARQALRDAETAVVGVVGGLRQIGAVEALTGIPRIPVMRPVNLAMGGGYARGAAHVVMGRPGSAKTSFLAQVSDVVSTAGYRTHVYSLEETASEWQARLICGRERVLLADLEAGKAQHRVAAALAELAKRPLHICDEARSTADIMADCEQARLSGEPVDVVIVDHLRLLSDKADNETHRLGAASWGLKQIAKRFNLVMLFAAQLSRAVEQRADKRPELADLRDSGEIEENVDTAIGLYREAYYNESAGPATEFLFRKNRRGATAAAKMAFDGAYRWFLELTNNEPF